MERGPRKHADDLRAASKLIVEATKGVTSVVEDMHRTIASGPAILGKPLARPAAAFTGLVYGSIRTITGLVGTGLDTTLDLLAPLLGSSLPGDEREALLAALNGVLGDRLAAEGNPLALSMTSRIAGPTRPRLLVLVHGSSMNDRQWLRNGHDHGQELARVLDATPVYLHYNTGLHVSSNGRSLSEHLERLLADWPEPVEELVLLGHSMGGLVARSALHQGLGDRWRTKVRALVCLGTPHHGSPVELGGNWIDTLLGITAQSAPLARLGKIRSAGVTDLRFGNVLDEHWHGRDRFAHSGDSRTPVPLPDDIACYAVAGSKSLADAPRLRGDGLVSVQSALGQHARAELTLAFPEANRFVALATDHLALLSSAAVFAQLREWLAGEGAEPARSPERSGPG